MAFYAVSSDFFTFLFPLITARRNPSIHHLLYFQIFSDFPAAPASNAFALRMKRYLLQNWLIWITFEVCM
jgi:hypothetical protein